MMIECVYTNTMYSRHTEFDQIKSVLEHADEPLTAREIVESAECELDSPHRVATILGTRAKYGDVDIIHSQPYRYQLI